MSRKLNAGDLVVMRTRKNEDLKILRWINLQGQIGDAIRYLIEQDIQQNGIRDLSQTLTQTRPVLPDVNDIAIPLLKEFFKNKGKAIHISEMYKPLADYFDLSDDDRTRKAATTSEPQWNNNVRWGKEILKNKGFVESTRHGYWEITKNGCKHIKNVLPNINGLF